MQDPMSHLILSSSVLVPDTLGIVCTGETVIIGLATVRLGTWIGPGRHMRRKRLGTAGFLHQCRCAWLHCPALLATTPWRALKIFCTSSLLVISAQRGTKKNQISLSIFGPTPYAFVILRQHPRPIALFAVRRSIKTPYNGTCSM